MSPLDRFRSHIEAILDPRKWPIEWVEQRIADGSITLFENDTAMIGVERRHYPGGLVELHCLFAAGELAGVLALDEIACEAGRLAGCDVATVASRPGWGKVLTDYQVMQHVLTKELR